MQDDVSALGSLRSKIPWLKIVEMLMTALLTVLSLWVSLATTGFEQISEHFGRWLDSEFEAQREEQLAVLQNTLDTAKQEYIAVLEAHLERPDLRFSRELDANPADPSCPEVVTETIVVVNEGLKTAVSVSVQVPLDGIIADRSFAALPHPPSQIIPTVNTVAKLIIYDFQQLRNGEKAKIYLALDRRRLRDFASVWDFLNAQEENLVVTCEDCPKATSSGPPVVPIYAPLAPTPTPSPRGECRITHVVKPGDTLSSIARIYGTSVWAIARANGIANINMIHSGQVLCVP